MKDKDYTVSKDKQSGYINTDCEPVTQFVTSCIICGEGVVVSAWNNGPKVCEDCKKAIAYAKKLMEKENGK
jgi:hypothetical protein